MTWRVTLGLKFRALLRPLNLRLPQTIRRIAALGPFDPEHQTIIKHVQRYTMTSPERIAATCHAVDHVIRYQIPGDFVECGVWRGGSTMAAALSYLRAGKRLPKLHLFDTFTGMTEPTDVDRRGTDGQRASALLAKSNKLAALWAFSPIDEVRKNIAATGYPPDRIVFVKGRVEDTIPGMAPTQIAVLRLDTDWYESTKHELEYLFPRISPGGVIIIDDYGDWEGARKAVDEYFASRQEPIFLARTDHTGRIGMKI